jgi:hypothetical protein
MPATARPTAARIRAALALACLITGMAMLLSGTALAQPEGSTVAMTQVRGVITPVVADHLHDTIEGATFAQVVAHRDRHVRDRFHADHLRPCIVRTSVGEADRSRMTQVKEAAKT